MKNHVVFLQDRYPDLDLSRMGHEFDDLPEGVIEIIPPSLAKSHYKYEEESCMDYRPQVDYNRLEVGDLVWVDDMRDLLSAPDWHEAEITHTHAGVVFYRFTDGSDNNEEHHLSVKSFGYIRGIYPKMVVVPDGITMECYCPYTEFITESEYRKQIEQLPLNRVRPTI